uniref:Uncharacterized protein n=1 Tax=Oryza meridionalis TaxID=40149 RepID=A0A0E0FBB4_9ORYZ
MTTSSWMSASTALRLALGGTQARSGKMRSLRCRGRWWRGLALLGTMGRDGRSSLVWWRERKTRGDEGRPRGLGRRVWRVGEVEAPFYRPG